MTWKPLLTRPVLGTKQAVSLTVGQYAKANNYSRSGVLYLIRSNKLRAFKHAGKWYIPIKKLR